MPASRATAFDRLAPDQRAAVELVLRQGRSYGELSDLLGMPEETIRTRARGGVAALAPDLPAPARAGEIADWLLGQQAESHAARTRTFLLADPSAGRWAATVAAPLREIPGGEHVPDLPTGTGEAPPRVNGKRASATDPAAAKDPAPRDNGAAATGRSGAAAPSEAATPSGGTAPTGRSGAAAPAEAAALSDGAATSDAAVSGGGAGGGAGGAAAAGAAARADAAATCVAAASGGGAGGADGSPTALAGGEGAPRGRSSGLGGALLVGGALLIGAVVLVFVVLRGGNDD